jgi:hypothetical protein
MYKKIIYRISDLIPAFKEINQLFTDEGWILTFQKIKDRRRTAQNRRYWAILHEISEQLLVNNQMLSADTWHEWAKRRFIGAREIPLPDGEVIYLGMSSTELSVAEFSDYMQMLEAWAIEKNVIFNDLPTENI